LRREKRGTRRTLYVKRKELCIYGRHQACGTCGMKGEEKEKEEGGDIRKRRKAPNARDVSIAVMRINEVEVCDS